MWSSEMRSLSAGFAAGATDGTALSRPGVKPDAHKPATAPPATIAPIRTPNVYAPAREFRLARTPPDLPGEGRSPAASAAAESGAEPACPAPTSLAVRSMVGGRRRGVLSGSLIMAPRQAADSVASSARDPGIIRK